MSETRRWWGEIRGRWITTVLVDASSRKEAKAKLRARSEHENDIEVLDTKHESTGFGRISSEYITD